MKAPNIDHRKHKGSRNCWNCDNADTGSRCDCSQRSRAAVKERVRREILQEIEEHQ